MAVNRFFIFCLFYEITSSNVCTWVWFMILRPTTYNSSWNILGSILTKFSNRAGFSHIFQQWGPLLVIDRFLDKSVPGQQIPLPPVTVTSFIQGLELFLGILCHINIKLHVGYFYVYTSTAKHRISWAL